MKFVKLFDVFWKSPPNLWVFTNTDELGQTPRELYHYGNTAEFCRIPTNSVELRWLPWSTTVCKWTLKKAQILIVTLTIELCWAPCKLIKLHTKFNEVWHTQTSFLRSSPVQRSSMDSNRAGVGVIRSPRKFLTATWSSPESVWNFDGSN